CRGTGGRGAYRRRAGPRRPRRRPARPLGARARPRAARRADDRRPRRGGAGRAGARRRGPRLPLGPGRAPGGGSAGRGGEAALGLARWAADLDRDLQRACRIAGGVRALWDAGARELGAILRVEPDRLARLIARRAAFDPGVEEARLADAGIAFVARSDEG